MPFIVKPTVTPRSPLIALASGSVWIDKHDTSGSWAADEKTAIEFEDKNKNEDEGSFQEEDVDTAH